ncbi:hypothetical protein [Rhizobium sp. 768_B6_N1_8]|uniref:hypothetical protein n=1 Tax=unclassified Rhizobium TaxID=2613769 RepID=UPI003F27E2C9
MHRERMALSHAAWTDLDALVLEEVNAVAAAGARPQDVPAIYTEDEFLALAIAYLRQREDPLRLIETMTGELGLTMRSDSERADSQLRLGEAQTEAAPDAATTPATSVPRPPS